MSGLKLLAPKISERMAIIGQTGTGKSELASRILPHYRNVGIFDPKRMFEYPDVEVFEHPDRLVRAKPHSFIYRPKPALFADIEGYEKVYRYAYEHGNIMVYNDDMVGIIPGNRPPHHLRVIYMMGRAKNVGSISLFQRPTCVPLILMTEATRFAAFRLSWDDDIKRVKKLVRGYDPERMGEHDFFYIDHLSGQRQARLMRLNLGDN